jgi:signal transduction histidine kinase
VILTDEKDEYPLDLHMEILKDPTRQLRIEEVLSPQFNGKFIQNKTKKLNLGLVNSAYWIRFQVNHQTYQNSEWWLELAGFEMDMSLYYPHPDGRPGFEVKQAGRTHPTTKGMKTYHYYPAFRLPPAPRSEQTIYLRLDGQRLNLSLTLWSSTGFIRKTQKNFVIKGCYLGVMLIMAVYNFFLFLALRDKSYLYYALFFICALSSIILRHVQLYLRISLVMNAVATLMVVFLLRFSGSFLMAKLHAPRLGRILDGLQIGLVVNGLLHIASNRAFLFQYTWFALVLFSFAVIFITSLVTWRRGYRPAGYFVLAQTILLVAFASSLLGLLGYVPLIPDHVPPIGLSLMAVLMSFALADRINIISKERELAEEKLKRNYDHLEELIQERTVELETANKELEGFSYSVSHDLRAPLRHIHGFIELLHQKIEDALDEQARHYMDTISNAVRKMEQLIDDLLSFSRMGRHAMTVQPVDPDGVVRDILREFKPETAERKIDWHIGDLPRIYADAAMLRVVLVNLISNALKFTRPRQPAIIEIGSLPGRDTETVIYVRDNGVGFDIAYVDKLFGVFQRLHREEEFEGTGIGLAIVYRIIVRHGGRIWAEGEVDQGSTFYFTLPRPLQEDTK